MSAAEKLLVEALALPEDEREDLAARILDSLEPGPHSISIDDDEEIERRAEEARRGEPGIPWAQVRANLP